MRALIVMAAVMVAGCSTPTYVMKNPTTGEMAQCHGDSGDWNPRAAANQCARAYEKAGWVRVN
jgi:hypothetical protein